jgi:hypothetical protein
MRTGGNPTRPYVTNLSRHVREACVRVPHDRFAPPGGRRGSPCVACLRLPLKRFPSTAGPVSRVPAVSPGSDPSQRGPGTAEQPGFLGCAGPRKPEMRGSPIDAPGSQPVGRRRSIPSPEFAPGNRLFDLDIKFCNLSPRLQRFTCFVYQNQVFGNCLNPFVRTYEPLCPSTRPFISIWFRITGSQNC